MVELDSHRRADHACEGVRSVGWGRLGSGQRPFRSHNDGPEREEHSDDCASPLRGTPVDVAHDVADCSSGSPNGVAAVQLTPCRDLPATVVVSGPREAISAVTRFAR